MSAPKLKVAIVSDWLVGGGAERVVLELHKMFPEAPIYTSYCTDEWRQKLDGKVVTGWLQHFGWLRKFLVLGRIWWFTHLDFSDYDLVVSSSGNGEAKGVRVPLGTIHICYCHSPTHYYWRHYNQYIDSPGFGFFDPLARLGLRVLVGPLRRWDHKAAQRPNYFIANSSHIQSDIKQYYERDATVIHPPIDIDRFAAATVSRRQGLVAMGRQVPYKRLDIIVQACSQLNLPLKVIGWGPEHDKLIAMAGPSVEFLTDVSDAEMPKYLAGAQTFLFAAFEDFGVAPVEALAAGTPVVAYKDGGALDYIKDGENGLFFDKQTVKSLEGCLKRLSGKHFDHEDIKASTQAFSVDRFRHDMGELINRLAN
jgi:glycosyltransferase involved in cell wall biosynthesis